MTLQDIPRLLHCDERAVDSAPISSVTEDSRRVKPGTIFVAVSGEHQDGHDFASDAAAAGAIAIVGNRARTTEWNGVPYFYVAHPRRALGVLAHALAGDPTTNLTVIGVTGTNGKSSTVLLTQNILRTTGAKAACFGTLGYDIDGVVTAAPHTTPFGEDLAGLFQRARDAGETHVVMEVSSHALEQERVAGIRFAVAAFTNLTQDHLDYHQDMDSYLRAKLMLFERIEGDGCFTVANVDDPVAKSFMTASRVPCHTFGASGDCRAKNIRMNSAGTTFRLETPWGSADCTSGLLGRHNVSNALCAATICGGLGIPLDGICEGIAGLASVPGRFERIASGGGFEIIVDYAHTDDGLRNVLEAAREICAGSVILVFGCGGDRDKGKRPKMGRVAAELADFAFVTSDNPRTEDPERILLDIEVGLQHAGKRKYDDYVLITDRASAIREAIGRAKPGDLVLIAGKGHEDYQILGAKRIHFDDREVARAILGER
jgi:UDP-N-acetylmuramoyl-L-alanyl-D-glutamate--2,6-diaminopimelate ligase